MLGEVYIRKSGVNLELSQMVLLLITILLAVLLIVLLKIPSFSKKKKKLVFTLCKAEHGVTRKRSTKRLKHTGNLFKKNLQPTVKRY